MKNRRTLPETGIGELSSLSRTVHVEGRALVIEVFRQSKARWGLQVLNGPVTTHWWQTFRTERAALDEALRVITEEGLDGFRMDSPLDPDFEDSAWVLPRANLV